MTYLDEEKISEIHSKASMADPQLRPLNRAVVDKVIELVDPLIRSDERAKLEALLREAIDAGNTLALHTFGRSENREVAEAKEQLDRARAALASHPTPDGEEAAAATDRDAVEQTRASAWLRSDEAARVFIDALGCFDGEARETLDALATALGPPDGPASPVLKHCNCQATSSAGPVQHLRTCPLFNPLAGLTTPTAEGAEATNKGIFEQFLTELREVEGERDKPPASPVLGDEERATKDDVLELLAEAAYTAYISGGHPSFYGLPDWPTQSESVRDHWRERANDDFGAVAEKLAQGEERDG